MSNTDTGTTAVEPWDKEFNAAIVHLSYKFLTRGYEVCKQDDMTSGWEYFNTNGGRPIIGLKEELDTLFADTEIEQQFRALLSFGAFRPESSAAHEAHFPHACPEMIDNGITFLCDAIVDAYGDDERTQRWRKAIIASSLGVMGFAVHTGQRPTDLRVFVEEALAEYKDETAKTLQADCLHSFLEESIRLVLAAALSETEEEKVEELSPTYHKAPATVQ